MIWQQILSENLEVKQNEKTRREKEINKIQWKLEVKRQERRQKLARENISELEKKILEVNSIITSVKKG